MLFTDSAKPMCTATIHQLSVTEQEQAAIESKYTLYLSYSSLLSIILAAYEDEVPPPRKKLKQGISHTKACPLVSVVVD